MCTVSVIASSGVAWGGGYRVVCNRDESRERPASVAPQWREMLDAGRAVRALWPTDPQGGGTWIAASDRGLVLSLLNLNPCPAVGPTAPSPASRGLASRGLVIPELIWAADATAAIARLRRLDLSDYAGFRLIAVSPGQGGPQVIEARWDRADLSVLTHDVAPACFTSSGLGDHLVRDRLSLFDQMVRPSPTPAAQDRYHRHEWPDRPELSVMMSREDARTVSVTTIDMTVLQSGRAQVEMKHHATTDTPAGRRWAAPSAREAPRYMPDA